jgi:hypothetical protein
MREHCPEAVRMRKLRALYKVGIEFTGWPTRPKPTPLIGPVPADRRFQPVDMKAGKCVGRCDLARERRFEKTVLGRYHK